MKDLRTATAFLLGSLLAACGGAAPTPPTRTSERASTRTSEPAPEEPAAEEPAAPGTQLAGGRLGSLLEGLTPGGWLLPGAFGAASEGPDAVSHHVLTRTNGDGSYELHLVAWDSFHPPSAPTHARSRRDRDMRTLEAADAELTVSASIVGPDEERYGAEADAALTEDRHLRLVAQLEVTVRDGTTVLVTLACARSAACDAEDREALAAQVARSLRHGPRLHGGGAWTLRLPDGAADRGVTLALPEGLVGLSARQSGRAIVIPAVSLATGRQAFSVTIRGDGSAGEWVIEPGSRATDPGPDAPHASIACEPFDCGADFTDEAARNTILAALASARVQRLDPLPVRASLARGRLVLDVLGPAIEEDDGRRSELGDQVTTHVRFEGSRLTLVSQDTLIPVTDVLGYARDAASATDRVELLETDDPTLRIARAIPEGQRGGAQTAAHLTVAEVGGTVIRVELECHAGGRCDTDAERISTELARRMHRGAPLPTTRSLRFRHGSDMIEVALPDEYAITEWYGEEHGGWGLSAHRVHAPAATLELEDSGDAPGASIENVGRRTGRRVTLRLGRQRFPMLERRTYRGVTVWAADIGGGPASVLMIRTEDLGARDSLLAALAAARVIPIPPCLRGVVTDYDALNVRSAPGIRAPVIGTLEPDVEVTVAETRGSWSRLSAPLEGWVWDESVARRCE